LSRLDKHESVNTRLIEFGRFAAQNLRERDLKKPETFDFLGFTHICGKTWDGRFWLRRVTIAKRMLTKLKQVKTGLRRRRHRSIPEQRQWLASVLRGHLNYYAVPGNIDAVSAFRDQVKRLWRETFRRRSQRSRMPWERFSRISDRWLPPARIVHPHPSLRFAART
ncbi:MAG: group II intron reverse transcriptase/maturase, partial [Ferrimicrobium acidiphilum]